MQSYISFQAIKTRFAEVLESKDAVLAAVTLPKLKLHWLQTHDKKGKAKANLLAECLDQEKQAGISTPTCPLSADSAQEDEFFSFENDTCATTERQVADYFTLSAQGIDSLNRFALRK